MLKPSIQVGVENGIFVAEFWDCLRLDPAPVLDLRKRFDDHVRSGGRPDLVVDLLGVGFAGSAALGGFVALQRVSRQHGGRMVFCNVDPTVHEVFRVSRLVNLYTFAADRPAALAALASPPPEAAAPPPAPVDGSAPSADGAAPAEPAPRPTSQGSGNSRLRRKPREG